MTSAGVGRGGEQLEAVRSANDTSVLPKEKPAGAGVVLDGDLRLLLFVGVLHKGLAVPEIRGREA